MSDIGVTVALVWARDLAAIGRARGLQSARSGMRTALALTLVVTLGCAETATVRRTDGPPTEAVIDSSDASTLYLRGPSGNMLPLGQYQVASIDHPGNVMALIGGCYAAAGLLTTAAWIGIERDQRANGGMSNGFDGVMAALGILTTVVGLSVFVPSMVTWRRSKISAHAFETERPPAWMIAPAVPGKPERIPPIRPPADGTDDEDPNPKRPGGFHR